ncbi:MAG: hypothetical protein NTW87_33390, partial [Planctomycetota bacterium]|nr:hypothetical protein [Planctomycetota bacterium]
MTIYCVKHRVVAAALIAAFVLVPWIAAGEALPPRAGGVAGASPAAWPPQVEQDWLRQAEARPGQTPSQAKPATTREDAAGGCDGAKNGKYGFHTAQEPNPWWQVDLGTPQPITKVVVYNRLDYAPGL